MLVIDDDSGDGTPAVCAELAQDYPLSLHVRTSPQGGLSGAVLHGMSLARGRVLAVMDADLQHPPERLPALLAPLRAKGRPRRRGPADFVLGSRYVPGGSTAEKWGPLRRLNSRVATLLARPFAGQHARPDERVLRPAPRDVRLRPQPDAAGLQGRTGADVQVPGRARCGRCPIHFDVRSHGQSKLTLREQFRYLEHLSRLYDFHYPRASPIAKFMIADRASPGWSRSPCTWRWCRCSRPRAGRLAAPVLAYPVAVLATAVFHARYVRTQREFLVSPRPWLSFWVISAAGVGGCAATAAWVAWRVHAATVPEVFVLSFGMATVLRYVLRKEFLLDVRGLRRQPRDEDLAGEPAAGGESRLREDRQTASGDAASPRERGGIDAPHAALTSPRPPAR